MFLLNTSRFHSFIHENKSVLLDSLFLITTIVVTGIILSYFEVTEWVYHFSREHEEFELDELILTVAISAFYLLIFLIRRFIELRKLFNLSNTDTLIGIANRRRGDELIAREEKRIAVQDYQSSLILIDIDNFKDINDTFGHSVGDLVLKQLGKLLKSHIRAKDTLVRWGGEEFLILSHRATIDDASALAERLRQRIEAEPFPVVGKVTVSFGVSALNKNSPANTQIDRADQALYMSKRDGKNRVTVIE